MRGWSFRGDKIMLDIEKILAAGTQLSPSQFVTLLVTPALFWNMTKAAVLKTSKFIFASETVSMFLKAYQ